MKILNLCKFLKLDKSFEPNYQISSPALFSVLFDHYVDSHYDHRNHPERYLKVSRDAYDYANKSILYDKLGIRDEVNPAITNSELFKAMFVKLASEDEDLIVKSEKVFLTDSLRKSFDNSSESLNEKFEDLWMKTFKTF